MFSDDSEKGALDSALKDLFEFLADGEASRLVAKLRAQKSEEPSGLDEAIPEESLDVEALAEMVGGDEPMSGKDMVATADEAAMDEGGAVGDQQAGDAPEDLPAAGEEDLLQKLKR